MDQDNAGHAAHPILVLHCRRNMDGKHVWYILDLYNNNYYSIVEWSGVKWPHACLLSFLQPLVKPFVFACMHLGVQVLVAVVTARRV